MKRTLPPSSHPFKGGVGGVRATFLLTFAGCLLLATAAARPAETQPGLFDRNPTLKARAAADLRPDVLAWLAGLPLSDDERSRAAALWEDADDSLAGPELLDLVAATAARVDDRARSLVDLCAGPRLAPALPSQDWLADESLPPLVRDNLRLVYGRWLAQERLYDEALVLLEGLEPSGVVDPASLLFYQGVVYHRLLQRDAGLKSIRRLLDDVSDSPRRYTSLAELMLADLEALEDESLDHISRRMDDIERRLDLGHAGPKVRQVEDGVIASLDKLIEEMEKQQQQQSGGMGAGATRSRSPAPDSAPLGGQGEGQTDRRDIGSESGWGDLPPRKREEALQQIGKDFPSHYRDVIEQYFRTIASEEGIE